MTRAGSIARGAAARTSTYLACAAAIAIVAPARARAEPVAVKVIEVAGGAAYLAPGRAAGLVPGTKVRLRGAELVVVEATARAAVVRIDDARISVGDTGTAEVSAAAAGAATRLAPPRRAEAFVGQWRDPVLPASQARPAAVPLGSAQAAGGAHVRVLGHAFAATGGGRRAGDAELRIVAAFDALTAIEDRPLAGELDVAARWFSRGADRHSRTPLVVRAAQLRYGAARDPALAVGRLRFAATSLGMLDGARASARRGHLELVAFGGVVPDPLSGKPDTGAARFGAELGYDAPEAAWRPHVALTAHGSTWNGAVDERRLAVVASGGRGALWLDGWAEAAAFSSDNPWGAGAIELTGAGASAAWRERGWRAAVDATFLRPERSLRLAAALPPEQLCTAVAPEATCAGSPWWGTATASLGAAAARWAVDVGATLGASRGQYRGVDRSGFARGELRAGAARLVAGIAGGTTSFASWTAGELGAGWAPTRALELAVTYRPELLDYIAAVEPMALHTVIADARVAVSPALDLAVAAEGTAGPDRDALAVLASFSWRPMP